tara:strand:- start:12471 stop:12977 length:507 start_codon:yes stop_codon:yes gene_type:complete
MSVKLTGTAQLFKNIDKIARWNQDDSKKLQDVGHKVGNVYANYLRANVKDLNKDINVKNKGKVYKVKKGQLRRSSGTWQPTKGRNTILAGPRTKSIGKRGKTKKYDDGWFAHIVEAGDFGPRFGGKHRTQNTGVFGRGIRATKSRSERLHAVLLRKNFANYARRLSSL